MKTPLIEQLIAMLPKEIKNDSGISEIEYGRNVCRSQIIALLPQLVEVVEKAMVERIEKKGRDIVPFYERMNESRRIGGELSTTKKEE